MTAKDLISNSITPLKTTDTGAFALSLMDEYKVAHLPVSENGEYLGLLPETDLLANNTLDIIVNQLLPDLRRVHVKEDQHLFDIISTFSANQLTVLPVTDKANQYMGSILASSLPHELAELLPVTEPGGVIILEVNDKDYMLSEIAQIVESNETKVLGMLMRAVPDSTRLEITLKLNRMDIDPVLQTFYRYNYTVKASYTEDSNHDDLMERFDSFLKYLNV